MWFQTKLLSFYSNLCCTYEISQNPPWVETQENPIIDFSLVYVRISTLLIEPVPTVCLSCHGYKFSKRSDFVDRVTIRVATLQLCADMLRLGFKTGIALQKTSTAFLNSIQYIKVAIIAGEKLPTLLTNVNYYLRKYISKTNWSNRICSRIIYLYQFLSTMGIRPIPQSRPKLLC
jgi:hypothetical protein